MRSLSNVEPVPFYKGATEDEPQVAAPKEKVTLCGILLTLVVGLFFAAMFVAWHTPSSVLLGYRDRFDVAIGLRK
jgi:hypothetical protein